MPPCVNFSRGSQEKLAHISIMQGKTAVPVTELHAGDIGAVAKLKDTLTGDTLGDKSAPIQYPRVKLPEPAITFAIEPKSRADEDKLGPGIHKLMEEDAMLRFFRDPQTKEFLIAGTGQQHIEVVVSKMKKRYHTEVVLKAPKVPYRETIRGKADVQGKHKKQTGGHGQYGDCKIKMEPLPRGGEFEFVNDIFGGSIPKNYIPAIEKGIKDAAARGYLAGFPVVDFRVILYDGSYHDVDSNDMSFQMAGRIAFKKAMEQAKPTLLEPVMAVEITVPDDFAGSIMGDLNSRRGRIQGMDPPLPPSPRRHAFARNHQREIRFALLQLHRIRRLLRAHIHPQFHVHLHIALCAPPRNLMDAGHLPRLDCEELRFHRRIRDHRLDRFRNIVQREAQAVGHHRN